MSTKAKSLKEAGNDAFRQGRYDDAILLYTEACQLDPSEYTYPLNRCMTYLKLNKLREAERDATKSLQLLPAGNPKALFRRGLARKGLGKIDLARQDFQAALAEEPSNASVKAELEGLAKTRAPAGSAAPTKPEAAQKATAEVPAKPSQPAKLPSDAPSNERSTSDRSKALKAAITPQDDRQSDSSLLSAVSTRRIKQPSLTGSTSDTQAGETPSSLSSETNVTNSPKDFKTLRAARDQRLKAASPVPTPIPAASASPDTGATLEATVPAKSSSNSTAAQSNLENLTAPKNMYEFEKRWHDNRDTLSRAGMIIALVKQKIPLHVFFGSSLTPELLDEILDCLKVACRDHPESRSAAVHFLAELPQCARFDFVSMLCANTHYVKSIVGSDGRASQILSAWGA